MKYNGSDIIKMIRNGQDVLKAMHNGVDTLSAFRLGLNVTTIVRDPPDDDSLVLFGTKVDNSTPNTMPVTVGWLYYNDAGEILYASGTPDNISKWFDWDATVTYNGTATPLNYSPYITPDNDVIFVFRGEQVAGDAPDPSARQNPIIYPHDDYSNPVVVDFGEDIKPTAWIANDGIETLPGIGFAFVEYTRPVHQYGYVWKVVAPYTTASNWTRTKQITVTVNNLKHFHHIQRDPWTGYVYHTTGDTQPGAPGIYVSTDNCDTWSTVAELSRDYHRLLNFIFTESGAFWATDDGYIDVHHVLEIYRDSEGVLDFSNIKKLYTFPNYAGYLATYATCYVNDPKGLLILNRFDTVSADELAVYFWSFETNTMHILARYGQLSSSSTYRLGFRCEAYTLYPAASDARYVCGFGYQKNNIDVLGNTLANQIRNISLEVVRKNNVYGCGISTIKPSSMRVLPSDSVSIPFTVGYNGTEVLTATYTIDGNSTTGTVTDGLETWVVGTLAEGTHTLSLSVSDADGITSNTLTFTIESGGLISTEADDWEQGSLHASTGVNIASTTRIRLIDYVTVKPSNTYSINMDFTNFKTAIRLYASNNAMTYADSAFRTGFSTFTTGATTTKLRMIVAYPADGTILPAAIESSSLVVAES